MYLITRHAPPCERLPVSLRANGILLSNFGLIGSSGLPRKIFRFPTLRAVPSRQQGRTAIVTKASCRWARSIQPDRLSREPAAMEAKEIGLQGERGKSRQPIAQGMPACSGCTYLDAPPSRGMTIVVELGYFTVIASAAKQSMVPQKGRLLRCARRDVGQSRYALSPSPRRRLRSGRLEGRQRPYRLKLLISETLPSR